MVTRIERSRAAVAWADWSARVVFGKHPRHSHGPAWGRPIARGALESMRPVAFPLT